MNYQKEIKFSIASFTNTHFKNIYNIAIGFGFSTLSIIDDDEYFQNIDDKINEIQGKGDIIIKFDKGSLHFIKNKHLEETLFLIALYFEYDGNLIQSLDNYIVSTTDIYYSFITSYYDLKWQNETSIESYKANNKSMGNLKFCTDIYESKIIDIQYNYGRQIYIDGLNFTAAYCSYFGTIMNGLFKEIELEKLDCFLFKKYKNGVVKIQLFENIISDYNSLRKLQENFIIPFMKVVSKVN